MRTKSIIYAARVVSLVFTPFYLPLLGLAVLFSFTYLSMLPYGYKLSVLLTAYFFTLLLPTLLIRLYRNFRGWTRLELGQKHRRMVPYAISIVCYVICNWIMHSWHIHYFITSILVVSLLIQVVCAVINVWWKVSTHTAAIGGVTGELVIFSAFLGSNPVWWLCLVLVLAGVLGSARMILHQHSLAQVLCGYFVGLVCTVIGIVLIA